MAGVQLTIARKRIMDKANGLLYYKVMQDFDAVAIGDSIVDVFIQLPNESKHYHVDTAKNELDLLLGEKNPVESANFSIGGNATHTAIGLSRLGFHVALASELGTDEFSQKILAELEKEKVAKNILKQTPNTQSTFTVSISIASDRITFVRHVTREHDFSLDNVNTPWVYLTSMGEKWEPMYQKTIAYVQKTGAKLAFNPGSMQLKKGTASFADVLKVCEVLFINKEEAEEILYGKVLPHEQEEGVEALLFRMQRMGPRIVVITDGAEGSYVLAEDGKTYFQKIFPVPLTEKTGAGDAFSTGFLAGVMSGKDMPTCLLWGTADAAGVVSKVGGHEGLLTMSELQAMLAKHIA